MVARLAAGIALAATAQVAAEQLSFRQFTQKDGLVDDHVRCLLEDSRGFLWIGTLSGLSRFDGERFVSYDMEDGLPHPSVNALAEDARGRLWVGTNAGVALSLPARDAEGRLFRTFTFGDLPLANSVNALRVDRSGHLLVATSRGLWSLAGGAGEPEFARVELCCPEGADLLDPIGDLAETADGSLWLATEAGLFRRQPDGRLAGYPISLSPDDVETQQVLVDHAGRVWVTGYGAWVFVPDPAGPDAGFPLHAAPPADPQRPLRLPVRAGEAVELSGMPKSGYGEILEMRDGAVWVSTTSGGFVFRPGGVQRLSKGKGLVADDLGALLEDSCGNVWIGTGAQGLMRLGSLSLTAFTTADGLATLAATSVFPDGEAGVIVTGNPAASVVHALRGDHFVPFRFSFPQTLQDPGWGWNQATMRDSRGEWWVPTDEGLFRFSRVTRVDDLGSARVVARYGAADGLGAEMVFRVFEDSRGDIWCGLFFGPPLARWERRTGRIAQYGPTDGLVFETATSFAEDGDGSVWIGFYRGGIARWRGSRFETFAAADGVPGGLVTALFFDSRDRLWVAGTRGGVARADQPRATRPRFEPVAPAGELGRGGAYCFAEDRWGRIYVGTNRGVDRLDPRSGRVWHFDTSNGLVNNGVISSCRDERGDIWFATHGGVSRLRPAADVVTPAPRLLFTEVRAGGAAVSVPEAGTETVAGLRLPSSRGEVEVGYTAVDLTPGPPLRFEYALAGPEGEWYPASAERRLHLARLAAGRYRVLVRAVRSDGATSNAASVAFAVDPPVWRRWWFVTLSALVLAAGVAALYAARIRRLRALQAVRERIAGDLHDELGLSLTRIAMLSEVTRRRLDERGAPESGDVAEIGSAAVELMEATSDIAWALDPARDNLESLLARLRRLASDVFEPSGVSWTFTAPEGAAAVALPADARRHLYLILKEAINNAARHSGASRVDVAVGVEGGWLVATVRDDGCGFDVAATQRGERHESGRGLAGMVQRARQAGGEVSFRAAPGGGTEIAVRVRVARR